MKPLTDSPHYRDFIASRDRAMETILQKYLRAMGQTVSFLIKRTEEVVSHMASHPANHAEFKRRRQELEKRLDPFFHMASEQSLYLLQSLRRTVYTLSYAGQAEAISRVLQKKFYYTFNRKDFEDIRHDDTKLGANPRLQVELAYSRLFRDVLDAFQLSQVQDSPRDETIERVIRAFPRERADSKPSRKMAPMKEAAAFLPLGKFRKYGDFSTDMPPSGASDEPDLTDLSSGTIEPEEWTGILDDYFSEYFPGDSYLRSPYGRIFDTEDGARYEWQLERDVTEDFVSQVRDGENEAANDQGITDFQWIAVVDDKTDDCCLWRDGLTTEEIEKALKSQHSDDECDAVAVPAHPLCRCRMAPMTKDMPEESQADFSSFDDWLEHQADLAAA
jgi:hypothetical protein